MKQRGFTIIEVVISMGIVVMLLSVTIPALNNMSRADLRKTSRMLSSLIQETYNSAALSGRMYRIVFNLKDSNIRVESSGERLAIEDGSNALVASVSQLDEITKSIELPIGGGLDIGGAMSRSDLGKEESSALEGLMGMGDLMGKDGSQSFEPVESILVVPAGINIMDVWTRTMEQPQTEGEATLYFFPNGFTQDAIIHFSNEAGEAYSVKVYALTGRTRVYAEYLEVD